VGLCIPSVLLHLSVFIKVILIYLYFILLLTAIVGDITPSDGIPKAEKSRREQEALDEMCEVLGGGPTGMSPFGT
jgi:hypothetical protein